MNNRLLFYVVIVLSLVKILSINFTNFDLFGDEAQYWLWSNDLDFGYYSKPPFLAWVIKIHTIVFGETFISLKLIPMIIYFIIAWSLYVLCKNIGLNKQNSIACALMFLLIPAVSFSSYIISTDILLLLFWTLSLNSLITLKKNPEIQNFILLGIFVGLAFLSKYAAIYFIICFLIYLIMDKEFTSFFVKNYFGFLITFFVIIIITFPNLFWNFKNGWITFQHTSDNANLNNIDINIFRGMVFLLAQVLMIGPFLFVGSFVNYKVWIKNSYHKFLLIFSLPIFLIVFIEAIIVRANANWAAPGLLSFFIFLYTGLGVSSFKKLNLIFNFLFCLIFFILIGISFQFKIFDRVTGLSEFAEDVYILSSETGISNIVVSDRLLFSSMSYNLRNKDLLFYMPHREGKKITNHFQLNSALKKDINKDFILIGFPNEINYLKNSYIIKKKNIPNYKFTKKKINIYEVFFR